MTIEGRLDIFQLPEILQVISQQRKTGILTVQGESDIVAVSFLNGEVVGADSLNQAGEEKLTAVLARQDLVGEEDLARARVRQEATGSRLQDVLLESGLIDRPRLLEAMRQQYLSLLLELLSWQEGEFKFYSNDEVSFEEGLRAISVQDVLLNALGGADAAYEEAEDPYVDPFADSPEPEYEPPEYADPEISGAEESDAEAWGADVPEAVFTPPDPEPKDSFFEDVLTGPDPGDDSLFGGDELLAQAPPPPAAPRAAASVAIPPDPRPGPADADDLLIDPFGEAESPEESKRASTGRGHKLPVDDQLLAERLALVVGLVLFLLLGAVIIRSPRQLLLPFPWQEGQRLALEAEQANAAYLKLDRAAKTFFLMHSRFPDRLQDLVDLRLLAESDLEDPARRPLLYTPEDRHYEVLPQQNGRPLPERGNTEAITGNFLLDFDFFGFAQGSQQPVILLD